MGIFGIFWKGKILSRTLGGGGYSWEFLMGVCHPVLQILTLLHTKNAIFHTIHTRFLTSSLGRNYVIITYIRAQTKHFSNAFRIRIFAFLSYSFGIATINTFIHSCSSLKNFTPRRCKNCTWWGSRYLYSLYKGVLPPPPLPEALSKSFLIWLGSNIRVNRACQC